MDVKFLDYQWRHSDPIYCSPSYLQSFNGQSGWISGYIDGHLRLVIPYTIKKKLLFKLATFQSAPVVHADPVTIDEETEFLNDCMLLLSKLGVDFCTQPPPHAVFRTYPNNAIAVPFGTYLIDLSLSEEDLWSRVHPKHRNVILNAKKKGVEIQFGRNQDILFVYKMLVQTMSRSGMPFASLDSFLGMIDHLAENVEIVVAYHDGKPMGCAVFPVSKYSAYYQYGGSVDTPVLGTMNLLHWEAMKHFKLAGVRLYDFVGARIQPKCGSKLEGIQRFKSRFGSEMHTGYLWKIPLSNKYYLYDFLRLIKGGGSKDIIDQELYEK